MTDSNAENKWMVPWPKKGYERNFLIVLDDD